jgi:hypothetical protein
VALSTAATCKLQTVLGVPPRESFIRAPVGLVKLSFLDCPDLLLGINGEGDSIVWNGVTGDVLHCLNREDGQILHPAVSNRVILSAMVYLTFVFGQCSVKGVNPISLTIAGVADVFGPSEYSQSFTRIQVQWLNRSRLFHWGSSASVSFPSLSSKIRVMAARALTCGKNFLSYLHQ